MTAQRVCILIFFAYLLGFLAHALYLQKTVYGDGIYYYSWLRSVVIDHDVNFPTGNKYAVGPALLWLPAFLWIHAILKGDGYHFWYQLTTGITSVFFVAIGLLLLFRLLNHYFSQTVSIATIAAIAFATNLFFYGSLDTVNSHGLSFFAACFYLSLIFVKEKKFFLIGIALGILGIIRMQDLIYGILLLPFIRWRHIPSILFGFLTIFSFQLVAWQILYGKFWISPYLTGGEGFTLWHPHFLEVLFSPKSGLFFWTPMLLLGLAGLFISSVIPAKAGIHRLFLLVILLQIWIVASWSTWWQGASYGGRMFVSVLPLFAFGLAYTFRLLQQYGWKLNYFLLIIIGPLSILNALFIFFFLLRT